MPALHSARSILSGSPSGAPQSISSHKTSSNLFTPVQLAHVQRYFIIRERRLIMLEISFHQHDCDGAEYTGLKTFNLEAVFS